MVEEMIGGPLFGIRFAMALFMLIAALWYYNLRLRRGGGFQVSRERIWGADSAITAKSRLSEFISSVHAAPSIYSLGSHGRN
jgi:hypothetical protein